MHGPLIKILSDSNNFAYVRIRRKLGALSPTMICIVYEHWRSDALHVNSESFGKEKEIAKIKPITLDVLPLYPALFLRFRAVTE